MMDDFECKVFYHFGVIVFVIVLLSTFMWVFVSLTYGDFGALKMLGVFMMGALSGGLLMFRVTNEDE